MPTSYPGREEEHDLGDGHSFRWLTDKDGNLFGLVEHHPPGPDARPGAQMCGGYVAWRQPAASAGAMPYVLNHQLVAGGLGDEAALTLSPSLLCGYCPSHGWIRGGRWIPA